MKKINKKKYPKISIVTVCYNEEAGIEDTCKSIISQIYNNYEWIVVDGGSTDNTLRKLDKYKSNITALISEKDNGVYDAMNKGIRIAKGEYMLFLNGGDYLLKNNSLKKASRFLSDDVDVLFGDAKYLLRGGTFEISKFPNKISKNYFLDKCICHQSAFIKKNLFKKHGLYSTKFKIVGDWEKWILFNKKGALFKKMPVILVAHKRFDGLSTAKTPEIWERHLLEEGIVLKKYFPILRIKRRLIKIIKEKRYKRYPALISDIIKNFRNFLIIQEIAYFPKRNKIGINEDFSGAPRVIVSLTSFPERMPTLHKCIESLLNQNFRPHKLILWLSREEFPDGDRGLPRRVKRLKKRGLDIEYCKDIKSYKKLIPTMKEYPNSIIITADDDICYAKNWLKLLYDEYASKPKFIHCHRANLIEFDSLNRLKPFLELKSIICENKSCLSFLNLISGCGGVLYPPNCFHEDVFNESKFMNICPKADDIWFWAMAVMNGTMINVIKNNISEAVDLLPDKTKGTHLWSINSNGGNNLQFDRLINEYPYLSKVISSELNGNKFKIE